MSFLEGYLVGLGMSIFIGPVFFTLLKSTLHHGNGAGISVAIGIFTSDALCIGLCSFGAIPFFENPNNQIWLAIAGSIILFGLGIKYLVKPATYTDDKILLKYYQYSSFFTQGFLVNFINPFVFLLWIGIIGYGQGKYGFTIDLLTFLGASLLGILTTDVIKVILAQKIKGFIRPKVLSLVFKIFGILLIGLGIRMIWHIYYNLISLIP